MRTLMRVALLFGMIAIIGGTGCGNPDKVAPDGVVSYNGGVAR